MGSKLRRLNRPVTVVSIVALIAAAATVTVVMRDVRATPASGITLKTASSASLAEMGITLSVPPANSAAIARSAAENGVQVQFPKATVREGALATVDDIHSVPAIHLPLLGHVGQRPAGGITLPSVGPAEGGARAPLSGAYQLLMFDAATGAFVEGVASN